LNIYNTVQALGFGKELGKIQILATGPWKEVSIDYDSKLQVFDEETMYKIDEKWKELLEKNPTAFKGALGSVRDFKVRNEILYLTLQHSRFDFYYGTKEEDPRIIDLSRKPLDERFSLPISFGAVSVTTDGYIPVGLRHPRKVAVARNMATTLPSGYFNPETQIILAGDPRQKDVYPSLMMLIATELKEELGTEFFSEIKLLGLVQDCINSKQPLIAVRLELPFTRNEVRKRAEDIKVEMERLLFLENKTEAIKSSGLSWTPHDVGKFILHFAMA
jgi:hypothetical protein